MVPLTGSRRSRGDAAVSSINQRSFILGIVRYKEEKAKGTFSVTLDRLLSFCMPHIK